MRWYPVFVLLIIAATFSLSFSPSVSLSYAALAHPAGAAKLGGEFSAEMDTALGGVVFLEDVGQYGAAAGENPSGPRFRTLGTNELMWFDQAGIWATVMEDVQPAQSRANSTLSVPEFAPNSPSRRMLSAAPRSGVNIQVNLSGANANPQIEPFDRLDTQVSYFRGQPDTWQTEIPAWGGLRYREIYPGMDLVITGETGEITFRLEAAPQADLQQVGLVVSGAQDVRVERQALQIDTAAGSLQLPLLKLGDAASPAPALMPMSSGQSSIKVSQLEGETIFEVAAPIQSVEGASLGSFARPDQSLPAASVEALPNFLPQNYLLAGTFIGGAEAEGSLSMAVDRSGNILLAGETFSPNFPTRPGGFDGTCGSDGKCDAHLDPEVGRISYTDAFVLKLDPFGRRLLWASFLGGSDMEWGAHLALGLNGEVYLTGSTLSPDFPTTEGSYNRDHNGNSDIFVTRFSANGKRLKFSTLVGGLNGDYPWDLEVGRQGAIFVTGETYSSDFPATPGSFDSSCGVDQNCDQASDGFLFRLSPDGKKLDYSTFVGASAADVGLSLATGPSGQVYLAGNTSSPDFPTTPGAYDVQCGTDGRCNDYVTDGFVMKVSPNGRTLAYATFLGGSSIDYLTGLAIDSTGAAYLTGQTESSDYPVTPGGISTAHAGGFSDLLVSKLDPTGRELVYSTYLGGSSGEWGGNLTVDKHGSVYVLGHTYSCDFPTTSAGFDLTRADGECDSPDGFVYNMDLTLSKIDPTGSRLLYGSFIGASGGDWSGSVFLDRFGFLVISGVTSSEDLPVTPWAYDTTYNGNADDFVLKLWIHGLTRAEGQRLYAGQGESDYQVYLPFVQ